MVFGVLIPAAKLGRISANRGSKSSKHSSFLSKTAWRNAHSAACKACFPSGTDQMRVHQRAFSSRVQKKAAVF